MIAWLVTRLLILPCALVIALLGSALLFTSAVAPGVLLVTLAIAWLYALSLSPVADRLLRPLEESAAPFDAVGRAAAAAPSFIAVLGGGFRRIARPPAIGRLQASGLARLSEGVRLARLLPRRDLVVCAYPRLRDESRCLMGDAALELGVPGERLRVVEAGRSTRSELQAIAGVVGNRPVLLVTSASHMPRAMALARELGLEVEAAPTEFLSHRRGAVVSFRWLPSSYELTKSERALYEYLARFRDRRRRAR